MLSNNKIMSVSHGSLPSNLVTLELRANPLKTVHESAIRNLKRLKKLYVYTPLISCNCSLQIIKVVLPFVERKLLHADLTSSSSTTATNDVNNFI